LPQLRKPGGSRCRDELESEFGGGGAQPAPETAAHASKKSDVVGIPISPEQNTHMADRACCGCAIAENPGVEINRQPFGKRAAGCRPLKANDSTPAAVIGDGGDDLGLSKDTYNFIGGLIEHADEIGSITNPTTNSYKRINGLVTSSGATWAPNTVTFAGNNRTRMVRAPGSGRFGFRLADGATNAYLFPATVLACGLDGIAKNADPGKPLDIDMYAEGHKAPAGVKKLPLNLLDALRITDGSALLRRELGDEFVDAYVKLKMKDWNEYSGELTPW